MYLSVGALFKCFWQVVTGLLWIDPWSNGKWQVVPSWKFTYPIFSQMFPKRIVFFQKTSWFWLLGNAENPTDLKPYWSRAGLRPPDQRVYCTVSETQVQGVALLLTIRAIRPNIADHFCSDLCEHQREPLAMLQEEKTRISRSCKIGPSLVHKIGTSNMNNIIWLFMTQHYTWVLVRAWTGLEH